MRHGHGLCLFADGIRFEGQWEWDVWVQSAACPKLSTVEGWGSARAVAGFPSSFIIKVRILNPKPLTLNPGLWAVGGSATPMTETRLSRLPGCASRG